MTDLLYHYTSEEGLKGIIEGDNIRATHVRFLNDWTEFREAFTENSVRIVIDSFRAELPGDLDSNARNVIDGMLSRRSSEILALIQSSDERNDTFVSSFASASPEALWDAGDRLSQWRGYSHSSQGYSLGFDKTLLAAEAEMDNGKVQVRLQECIYAQDETVAVFQELGRTAALRFNDLRARNEPVPSSFETKWPNPSEEYLKSSFYSLKAFSAATARFFTMAARIKNVGFREEFEQRVILQANRDVLSPETGKGTDFVKFRDGQFGRTPFVEISLGLKNPETSPLRRIVVGPGTHKEDVRVSTELFLLSRGIQVRRADAEKGVEVATSVIPYRSG